MKCISLAALLEKEPETYPVIDVGDKWVGVKGLKPTLAHKLAVTFAPADSPNESLRTPELVTELLGPYRLHNILLEVGGDFAEITGVVAVPGSRASVTFSTAPPDAED